MSERVSRTFAGSFRLGPWTVDPGLDRLEGGGSTIALEPKAMDLLLCLARRAGETVSKETILDEVWGGAFVVEAVIPKTISALRTALGDDAAHPTFILTVPRRGYRLVAAVSAPVPGPSLDAEAFTVAPPPADPLSVTPASTPQALPERRHARRVAGWIAVASLPLAAIAWLAKPWEAAFDRPAAAAGAELPDAVQKVVLEARHLWSLRGIDSVRRANDLLVEAAKEAPQSAEVQGWLALSSLTRGSYLGEMEKQFRLADEHAHRAIELDPDSAIAECALGALAVSRDRDPEEGIRRQTRAAALDPNLVAARQFLAEALSISGRHEEALVVIEEAIRMEPLSAVLQGVRGIVLQHQGRPLAALEAYDRVLVLEPKFGWVHRNRSWALLRLGREREAAESIYLSVASVGEAPEHLAALRAAIDADGYDGHWSWLFERLQQIKSDGIEVRPMTYAEALAGTGRFDEALAELERASAAEDGEFLFFFRDSVAFDELRDRPEFIELYARHGAR